MNSKISVFVICVEVIIYLLLDNLHDFFTFKQWSIASKDNFHVIFLDRKLLDIRTEKLSFNFAQFRAY